MTRNVNWTLSNQAMTIRVCYIRIVCGKPLLVLMEDEWSLEHQHDRTNIIHTQGMHRLMTPFFPYIVESCSFMSTICTRQPPFGVMFNTVRCAAELMGH